MPSPATRLWKEQRGQDLVEYALLVLLVAFMLIVSVKSVSEAIGDVFTTITNSVAAATSGAGGNASGQGGSK